MYPIISPRPHTQVQVNDPYPLPTPHRASTTSLTPTRAHQRSKRDLPPPPDAPPEETTDRATSEPLPQHWTLMEPSPRPKKKQRQLQKEATKVVAAHTVPTTTAGDGTADPVPQRWTILEPSPRPTKQQRRQAYQPLIVETEGNGATEPRPQRWTILEDSPRPTAEAAHRTGRSEGSTSKSTHCSPDVRETEVPKRATATQQQEAEAAPLQPH